MKRKNFILSCLFIFVLSIAAVSASEDTNQTLSIPEMESNDAYIVLSGEDTNQTLSIPEMESNDADIASVSNNEKNSYDNQTLGQSENDDILTAGARTWYVNSSQSGGDGLSPETAFKTVQDALNKYNDSDTIMIASGLYSGDGNVELGINKSVTLKKYGDGDAIFDGNKTARIIYTYSNIEFINIYGLTFKNGMGSAIALKGVLSNSNINATFINNNGIRQGGAISVEGKLTKSTITGTFINNTAIDDGGAIYFEQKVSNLTISGTFINNTAENGGAIKFQKEIEYVTINGTFINNTAESGGANYFLKRVTNSNIGGTYINNTAFGQVQFESGGGANYIYKESGSLYDYKPCFVNSILSGTYINNNAYEGGANFFYGVDDVSAGIIDSTITGTYINNTAYTVSSNDYYCMGGANYIRTIMLNSNITGTYISNFAMNLGGAIYVREMHQLTNVGGTYINNTGVKYGSAVCIEYAEDLLITARFINNTGYSIVDINAPAESPANLRVENSIFLNNKCSYDIRTYTNMHYQKYTSAKNNWFGNNLTNYQVKPKVTNELIMDTWLFLNGTLTEDTATFFLMSYNDTSKTTSMYDDTPMGTVNLTISAYYATADKSHAVPNEVINYVTLNKTDRPASIVGKMENTRMILGNNIGEFDYLQEYINDHSSDEVVYIDRNYTYNELDTITTGVVINSNMIIDGQGFTIDAKGKSRIFNITAGSIKITNIVLQNGNADNGGAIYFANELTNTYIDANYINNTATVDGGAIYFAGDVKNSEITGTYVQNTATQNGGANNFNGKVTASNVSGTYTQNTAEQNGGANHFDVKVSDSKVSGKYSKNSAANGGANQFGYGILNSTITGTYINNTATQDGGANYNVGELEDSNLSGTYINNTAGQNGGANHFNFFIMNSSISGTYTQNSAAQNGGANHFGHTIFSLNLSGTYTENTASSGGANQFAQHVQVLSLSGTYIRNTATENGGANQFNDTYPELTDQKLIINGTYVENSAEKGGANQFNDKISSMTITVTGTYTKNRASQNGGANQFNDITTDMTLAGTYIENEAANGGANYFNAALSSSNITGTYENNTAKWGGANYFNKKVSSSNMTGIYTGNNATQAGGGANYFKNGVSSLTMVGTFTGNEAKTNGGVNFILGDIKDSSISGTYTENKALVGGANYLGTVTNSNITGTYAKNQAGSGAANNMGRVTSSNINGTYTENKATSTGGANYFSMEIANSIISGTYINNTVSGESQYNGGGANYFKKNVENSLISGTYDENNAKRDGGANYFYDELSNSNLTGTYINNTARHDGGANYFYDELSNSNLTGTYKENKARNNGGANHVTSLLNSKVAGTYENNQATEEGGANRFDVAKNSTITGTYVGNEGYKGGTHYFNGDIENVSVSGTYIKNNADSDSTISVYGNPSNVNVTNAIFLNNIYSSDYGEIHSRKAGVATDNNWFGSTADNYATEVPCQGAEAWLFLNATSAPLADSYEIVFKLYAYNKTSGKISDYDNSLLEPVNLTITKTNGDVDKDIAKLDETIIYTLTDIGAGSVTASVENVAYTIVIGDKADPNLSVGNQEVCYSNNTRIALNYYPSATGTVNITLKGKKFDYNFTDVEVNATVSLGNINADEYDVLVEYSGNTAFTNASATGTLKVNKANSTLTFDNVTMDYGTSTNITVTADGATGVTAKIDGKDVTVIDNYTIPISGLNAKIHNLTVTTIPDENHNQVNRTVTITVNKISSTVNVDDTVLNYGETTIINVTAEGANVITAELDGDEIIFSGYSIPIPVLNAGTHNLTITTIPDENHTEANKTAKIYVLPVTPAFEIEADSAEIFYGDVVKISVKNISAGATGKIEYYLDNSTLLGELDINETLMLPKLNAGTYLIVANYLGDENYKQTTDVISITINKANTTISANPTVNNTAVTVEVNVDSSANGYATIGVLGQRFLMDVENGKAVFKYDFEPGTYNADVVYLGDVNFNNASTTVSFTVIEHKDDLKNTTIDVDVVSFENNVNITVTVDSSASGLVEFNINGSAVYLAINNGKATYGLVLPAGNYNLTATYLGDSRFNANRTSKAFTIVDHIKKNTTIVPDVIINGYNVTVDVAVDVNATGFVEFTLNGNTIISKVENGKASMTTILLPGNYSITVAYLGDDDFNANETVIEFTVSEIPLKNTTIESEVVIVDNNITITVNIDKNATGLIKFTVSGAENYTLYIDVNDGKAVLEDVLAAGDYSVIITYLGDENYYSNSTTEEFTVTGHIKKNTTINLDIDVDGYNVTITATVDKNATGFVEFALNGNNIVAEVKDGKAAMTTILWPGNYSIAAVYLGNNDFNANGTETNFTVNEILLKNTTIESKVVIVDNNITITVNIDKNATGLIKFAVSGAENYTVYVDVNDGKAVLEDVLAAGDYSVIITYLGDENYYSNSTTEEFTVVGHIKKDTEITALPTVDGTTVTIDVNINENATGDVVIGVLGQNFIVPVNNGKAIFKYDFFPGTYSANVAYLGDADFNHASTTVSFTVTEHKPELKNTTIDVDVVSFENNVNITVTVDSSASGLVEFNINGKAAYIAVNNGKAAYSMVLPAGNYNLTATYLGDSKFNANRTSKAFTIVDHIKKNTTIVPEVIVNGYNVTVDVAVDVNATGFVEFTLNGNTIISKVENGQAAMTTILLPGNYSIAAVYLGDDDFNTNETVINFTVSEIPLKNTTIESKVVIVDNNITITVSIDKNATGLIKFQVSGTENYTLYIDVENGQAILEDVLTAGDYSVIITYLGDNNYYSNSTTEEFTVIGHVKKNTTINLDIDVDGYNVTITATVDVNATGFVEFLLNGNNIVADVKNGKAEMSTILLPGDYTIVGAYLGNDNFNTNETALNFTVSEIPLKNTTIESEVVIVDNNITITVSIDKNATGLIKFAVSGAENYTVYVNVNDGKAVLEDVLTAGDYSVVITYLGDNNYYSNSTTEEFTVIGHIKKDTEITALTSVDGTTVTIDVNINENATGDVVIGVLGQNFIVPVNNGKAIFKYDFFPGIYGANVAYLGDANFNNATATVTFTVIEHKTDLKNTTIDVDVVSFEHNVNITATVDSSASGLVEFNINGKTVYIAVNNGKAIYNVVLPAGEYNVVATYIGDSRYNANVTSQDFVITDPEKHDTNISIVVPSDINPGESASVDVSIPGATGNVSVIVDGNEVIVSLDENGTASVVLENISSGSHSVVAIYPGDETHAPAHAASSFDVSEISVPKTSEFSDITITDAQYLTAVLKDSDGNPIANATITYAVNGIANTTVTAEDGQFTIKIENDALMAISYAGSEGVVGTNITLKLNSSAAPVVVKIATHFDVDNRAITINGYAVDTKAGEEGIYYATRLLDAEGNPVSNAYMEFGVNNKIYNRTTYENGSYKPYKLNMIRAGRYTMALNFAGDDNYTNAFACVCFDLDKKPITIKASAKSYKASTKTKKYTVGLKTIVGSSHDGKAHLRSGLKVTLKVNGKTYSGKTNSKGKVTFKITNLKKKAKYVAKISYAGDKTYKSATKSVKLTIK